MKRHLLFLLVSVSCIASFAQGAPSSEQPTEGEVKAAEQFKWLDRNGDRRLSRDELFWVPRGTELLERADSNHDGLLIFEEVRQFALKLRAEKEAKEKSQGTPDAVAEGKH